MAAGSGHHSHPFYYRFLALALVTAGPLVAAGGCLSFGDGATHVHDNPETTQKIVHLEERVQMIERMLARPPELLPAQTARD